MPASALTEADRRLLRLLQRNGRASIQELAEAAGMSSSPVWRRIKRLESLGVIQRHVVLLDRKKLGLRAMVYVQVTLIDHAEATVAAFDGFVQGQARILECARVTGGFDYLLKVVTRDAEDLDAFLMRELLATDVVRAASTSLVLRQTKSTTELPLD